jgi:hypothetical protein
LGPRQLRRHFAIAPTILPISMLKCSEDYAGKGRRVVVPPIQVPHRARGAVLSDSPLSPATRPTALSTWRATTSEKPGKILPTGRPSPCERFCRKEFTVVTSGLYATSGGSLQRGTP